MGSKIIEELLERYYNGETTLAEEQQIKEYLERQDAGRHLDAEQVMLQFYTHAAEESTKLEIEEQLFKTVEPRRVPLLQVRIVWPALAASIFIIMGAGFFFNHAPGKKANIYGTYSNPELAYAETQRALLLISEKLNKGTKDLDRLSELDRAEHLLTNKKNEQ